MNFKFKNHFKLNLDSSSIKSILSLESVQSRASILLFSSNRKCFMQLPKLVFVIKMSDESLE